MSTKVERLIKKRYNEEEQYLNLCKYIAIQINVLLIGWKSLTTKIGNILKNCI
jgi:hypothetical protein